jgi:hypothetical protein
MQTAGRQKDSTQCPSLSWDLHLKTGQESFQAAHWASKEGLDKEARVFVVAVCKAHLRKISIDPYSLILLTLPKRQLTPPKH